MKTLEEIFLAKVRTQTNFGKLSFVCDLCTCFETKKKLKKLASAFKNSVHFVSVALVFVTIV